MSLIIKHVLRDLEKSMEQSHRMPTGYPPEVYEAAIKCINKSYEKEKRSMGAVGAWLWNRLCPYVEKYIEKEVATRVTLEMQTLQANNYEALARFRKELEGVVGDIKNHTAATIHNATKGE